MNKELTPLEALEKLTNYKCSCMSEKVECKKVIENALKDYEDEKKTSYNRLLKIGELVGQINEKEEEIEKGKKFIKIIREIYANGVGIDKVFNDIKNSDDYESFKETYPYCPKDWYDLLKEVLL